MSIEIEQIQRDLLDRVPEPVMIFDMGGECRFSNTAADRLWDPAVRNSLVVVLEDEVSQQQGKVTRVACLDGSLRSFHVCSAGIDWGGQSAWMIISHDITGLKQSAETLQNQNAYLSALHGMALALMKRSDVEHVLEGILSRATQLFTAAHGFIQTVDPKTRDALITRVGMGVLHKNVGRRLSIGEGVGGKVLQTGKLLLVDDYSRWEGRNRRLDENPIYACVGVPLLADSQTIGVLSLAHDAPGKKFSAEDLSMLDQFARLASIALDNASLQNSLRQELVDREQTEVRLKYQSHLLQGVAEASRALLSTDDFVSALKKALTVLGETNQVDSIFVYQHHPATQDSAVSFSHRFGWNREQRSVSQNEPDRQKVPYGPIYARWMKILSARGTIGGPLKTFPPEEKNDIARWASPLSLLVVPIFAGEQYWGFAGFEDYHFERQWTEDEEAILMAAGVNLGAAVERWQVGAALHETDANNAALLQAIPDMMIHISREGEVKNYKPDRYVQAVGMDLEIVVGENLRKSKLPPAVVELSLRTVRRVLDNGKSQSLDFSLNGQSVYFSAHFSQVREDEVLVIASNVTLRKQIEQELLKAQKDLRKGVFELSQRNHEMDLLSRMNTFLQICNTHQEAYTVIVEFVEHMFPNRAGHLLMVEEIEDFNEEKNGELRIAATWGPEMDEQAEGETRTIHIEDCWAMVNARSFLRESNRTDEEQPDQHCKCAQAGDCDKPVFCLPIMAQFQADDQLQRYTASRPVGVLSIWSDDPEMPITDSQKKLATTMVEQFALAFSNLSLRQLLHRQATIDSLTGLYNRRYLFEALGRELKRSEFGSTPVGVLMLDLDHFKEVNDTYGHAAGDAVLNQVGRILSQSVRGRDLACRYGGEEFVLIMVDTGRAVAARRAHKISDEIRDLKIKYSDAMIDHLTVSIGVAVFPEHGKTVDDILSAADAALYRAKGLGRDRVSLQGETTD